jgi:hypothetical protein
MEPGTWKFVGSWSGKKSRGSQSIRTTHGPLRPLPRENRVGNLSHEALRRLTRLGAVARLEQLREEEASIRAEFPELFGRGRRVQAAPAETTGAKRRKRKAMTPAQKKAVSERMRKYWAERRKTKSGK